MLSFSKRPLQSLLSLPKFHYSKSNDPIQKIIMLCGAPGVGKGMYSRMLAFDFGYHKISIGDEIRSILSGRKSTGLSPNCIAKLKDCVNQGKLVSDDLVMEVLYQKIKEPISSRGVILDGFPRTVNQLKMFNEVFPIHLVVNIVERYDYLMASILGRRTCMDCGVSYSAYAYYKDGYELDVIMPEKEGVCDHCGGSVGIRDDDNEEIVKKRLKEYEEKTFPFLEKMNEDGNLVVFEPKRGVRDYPRLQQIVVARVGLPYYFHQYYNKDYNISEYYN